MIIANYANFREIPSTKAVCHHSSHHRILRFLCVFFA